MMQTILNTRTIDALVLHYMVLHYTKQNALFIIMLIVGGYDYYHSMCYELLIHTA